MNFDKDKNKIFLNSQNGSHFDKDKGKNLKKMDSGDKSDKGSVDKPIKHLLKKINSLKDYYTTSSCSGRIILIKIPDSGKKKEAEFIYRTHEKADYNEVSSIIKQLLNYKEESIWFRQESAIVHVCARTLQDASKFLRIARRIGFKRCGLFEVDKRFMMELVSTERIDTIVARKGKVLVSDDYLKVLVEEANKKLEKTWEKINKLEREISTF